MWSIKVSSNKFLEYCYGVYSSLGVRGKGSPLNVISYKEVVVYAIAYFGYFYCYWNSLQLSLAALSLSSSISISTIYICINTFLSSRPWGITTFIFIYVGEFVFVRITFPITLVKIGLYHCEVISSMLGPSKCSIKGPCWYTWWARCSHCFPYLTSKYNVVKNEVQSRHRIHLKHPI